MLASADRELVSSERANGQAVRRAQQTIWRRERRHAGVTFPARVINGSEHTKWRSFTELRCEREDRRREGVTGRGAGGAPTGAGSQAG